MKELGEGYGKGDLKKVISKRMKMERGVEDMGIIKDRKEVGKVVVEVVKENEIK